MARFIAIDMAGMVPPDIIETLDYETIVTALKDAFQARMAELGLDFDVRDLESEPAVKLIEVFASREIVLRARVNGGAKALLLALAKHHDLEHLGNWFGTERAEQFPATTDQAAILEDDERLRKRIQLAPQAFSTAGPYGAYEYHVLTADPLIKSVGILVPQPGHVNIYPLVVTGDGTPSEETLRAVRLKLLEEDIRPLTDIVSVAAPKVLYQDIDVTLVVKEGPDAAALAEIARGELQTYADSRHFVGEVLRIAGIYDAAQMPAVENVIINEPTADVDPTPRGAVYVPNITVRVKVIPLRQP